MTSQAKQLNKTQVTWTFKHLLVVSSVTVFLLATLIILGQNLQLSELIDNSTTPGLIVIGLLIIQNSAFLLPIIGLFLTKKIPFKNLGFNKIKPTKLIGYTILGFITFLLLSITINNLQLIFDFQIPGFGDQDAKLPVFGNGIINQLSAFLTIVILAPIMEEVIFRGFLYQTLVKYSRPLIAIPAAGFIFAIAHLELNVILPLWLLGTIICYLFYKTNSIYTVIVFHILNNLLAFSLEYLTSSLT